MGKKINIDYEVLHKLYKEENKSMNEISEILKISRIIISQHLDKYNLKDSTKHNNRRRKDFGMNIDELKVEIYDYYINQNKNISFLMNHYGFTRYKTKQLLKEFNIVKQVNKTQNKIYDNKELLFDLYINQQKPIYVIGALLGCSDETVSRYLHKYNIPVKYNQAKIYDKDKTYSPYKKLLKRSRRKFENTLRIRVLKRDNCKCNICCEENKLEVHHLLTIQDMVDNTLEYFDNIDLNNKNHLDFISDVVQLRIDYNNLNNMITLCKDCHINVHTNKLFLESQTTIPTGSTLEDWLPMEVLDTIIIDYHTLLSSNVS